MVLKSILEFAEGRFKALMEGTDIPPDIMKSVLQVGAYTGNTLVYDWFVQRMDQSRD